MAKYSHGAAGWTPIAHADGATDILSNSYQALRTTTASTLKVGDVIIGGEATTSTVNRMAVRRASGASATPTNQAPAPLNPLSAASVSQGYVAATTGPDIASTQHLLNLALNVFGGIMRWHAGPDEELWATAGAAPNGELVLDSISGVGLVTTSMVFEEV